MSILEIQKKKKRYTICLITFLSFMFLVICFIYIKTNETKIHKQQDLQEQPKKSKDDRGVVGKDKESIERFKDKKDMSDEEKRLYDDYDPLGKNDNDVEVYGEE